ncbi:cytochrome P450 [Motilibacter deserti]|uniref:Cytochrome P450 n=1 Tax=Motilibacter deserti TaxID=2714956 RepID=A0ABX0H1N7_9ACTN|nr:cytochrome P450 [Motilibacter deserti]NHC15796.1 cytochrome P450 [Motilibacter deserti]
MTTATPGPEAAVDAPAIPVQSRADRARALLPTSRRASGDGAAARPGRAPGPRGPYEMVRNLRRLQSCAPLLFQDLHRSYGDVVRLPLGPYLTHLNLHPDGVRHVLQDNNRNYVRGKMYERFKIFFGIGLLTTDGEEWRVRRRRVNPLFHQTAIAGMATAMTDATSVVLDRWERSAAERTPVDVVPEMMDLSLGALGHIIFGTDLWPSAPRVAPAMAVSLEAMIFKGTASQMTPDRIPTRYNRTIADARGVIDEAVRAIVAEHRREGRDAPADLVDLLLHAQASEDGDEPLSDDLVHDEMRTIFMAGHETTGTGLAWALHELAWHEEVQERAAAEVAEVLGDRVPTVEDVRKLTYVRMVVDETLRLHPPIWLYPRDAVEDDEIGGYRIPAGTHVFQVPFVTHRHPDLWERPTSFEPDRFAPDATAQRPRFAYFPFGGGQRQCIGNQMALLQTTLTLAMVLQRFRLDPTPGRPPELGTLVSLRPLTGLPLAVSERSP